MFLNYESVVILFFYFKRLSYLISVDYKERERGGGAANKIADIYTRNSRK